MIMEYFSSEFFAGNRQRLKTLFTGTAPIILTANGLLQRNGDCTYTFRQDSNFWYLTGTNEPDIILVLDKDSEYFILPERANHRDVFDGAISGKNLSEQSGVITILDAKTGWKKLKSRLERVMHVATLAPSPAYLESHNFYVNPARAQLINRLKECNENLELLDLRQHIMLMRMVKQKPELSAIQRAINITNSTIKNVSRRNFAQYKSEFEIEAAISNGFNIRGATGSAWVPIVANGKNACTIHSIAKRTALNRKGLLLLDVGAEVSNYSADISRTYSLDQPTKRQEIVFAAVLDVQDFALSKLKPGVVIKEYEKLVEQYMGEKLRELGVIKTIESKEVRKYYPHATSHFLGLDTHDVGDYTRPLEPGMVLTVEPGIYLPKEGIGVRIEDDVLITKTGHKVLSAALPRTLQ